VARLPKVREVLVRQQRALGQGGAIVMEGRDIGTVVFPEADLKFYIDASAEERARRRASDPAHTGGQGNLELIQNDMSSRDKSDSTRSVSPLVKANDAIYIDTTTMPIEAVVNRVMMLILERLE
jgi:cytidylate kinase